MARQTIFPLSGLSELEATMKLRHAGCIQYICTEQNDVNLCIKSSCKPVIRASRAILMHNPDSIYLELGNKNYILFTRIEQISIIESENYPENCFGIQLKCGDGITHELIAHCEK